MAIVNIKELHRDHFRRRKMVEARGKLLKTMAEVDKGAQPSELLDVLMGGCDQALPAPEIAGVYTWPKLVAMLRRWPDLRPCPRYVDSGGVWRWRERVACEQCFGLRSKITVIGGKPAQPPK